MTSLVARSCARALVASSLACLLLPAHTQARGPAARLATPIDDSVHVPLRGSRSPLARPETDVGALASATRLHGVSLAFSRTASQEAELQALIAAQHDPASPLFHRWLTPEEFAGRFGMSDSDLAATVAWLQRAGLSVEAVSRSRNRIRFSGTAGQIASVFGAELRTYRADGTIAFAPSTDASVPAALGAMIQAVANLSSFRPRPHLRPGAPQAGLDPAFTSGQTSSHFLTPADVATVYDVTPAYDAGLDGTGQSIAVVGQSAIVLSDIAAFQTAAGVAVRSPQRILVPGSGAAAASSGDEAESDLDLEYTSAIAPGATITFVYVGDSQNWSVWDSIEYAVDNDLAPIISVSYGLCEGALSSSDHAALDGALAQAAAQGQSVIVASGDSGSTDCYGVSGLTSAVQESLAVDFPASSQYVTGMGGTEFSAADVASTDTTYWLAASGTDLIGSARSYIPELVWNDDSSSYGLSAGGGGVSTFTARPSWQVGAAGIPAGTRRLVPDISLSSSPSQPGYLYCSSDTASTGITGSCSKGFRDADGTYLTVAGGTSFAAPIFAGMLALLNQKLGSAGQGVVAATLFQLAANPTTYATVFHDVTEGSNACAAGSGYCSTAGASSYSAGAGYDLASGLGSIDFEALLSAWPAASLLGSQTLLSAESTSPAAGASDTITIAVAPGSTSGGTPTGTVAVAVDGGTVAAALPLSGGQAAYTFSSSTAGSHTVTAVYSGDATFASSRGTVAVAVAGGAAPSFTLSAASAAVPSGGSGASTITITPANGYTGTITWTVTSSPAFPGCFELADATVSGTDPVGVELQIHAGAAACAASARAGASGATSASASATGTASGSGLPASTAPLACWAAAALMLAAPLAAGPRRRARGVGIRVALAACLGLAGCAGSSGSSASGDAYTVTIVGTDSSSSSITATTTMKLTVD